MVARQTMIAAMMCMLVREPEWNRVLLEKAIAVETDRAEPY
jgi:hypothetical protein